MPTDPFLDYINPILGIEGGYANHPSDRGGETMWGITIARARAAGYKGAMRALSKAQAIEIYRLFYWQQPAFDKLYDLDADLGLIMLDLGINFGQGTVGRFLQRSLNVLNLRGSLYPDMTVDGLCGALTRSAVASLLKRRGNDGRKVLVGMIRAMASVRYVELAEANPSQEDFEFGWQLNRGVGTG